MKTLPRIASAIAALLGMSIAGMSSAWAHSLGGCVNSPENPTVVLGLLGGAAAAFPWLRGEFSARLRKKSRSGDFHRRDAHSDGE